MDKIQLIEYAVFFLLLILPIALAIRFFSNYDPIKEEGARCESYIEKRLYNGLVKCGMIPRAQFEAGRNYRIDLSFPESKIAIECDGKAFHSSPAQKAHDRKKDRYLRSQGWTVLRFSGSMINRELSRVIGEITQELNGRESK
ncbi:endonuclease domain-containing protein [Halobacillus mangrovi]|uniref:endonuclease domain-containing protein n=1 Tax=Halobacillus mangrovi TaxID=402384 RepID=UPI003D9616F1